MLRAAHQFMDAEPRILDDPVITRILGPTVEERIREQFERFESAPARALRSHIVLRSRLAEDALHEAIARGCRQFILLGAGLDTFAYRQPEWARALRIVEVDHPASQAHKQSMLQRAGVTIPDNVVYASVDFEHETLADGLRRHGVG